MFEDDPVLEQFYNALSTELQNEFNFLKGVASGRSKARRDIVTIVGTSVAKSALGITGIHIEEGAVHHCIDIINEFLY